MNNAFGEAQNILLLGGTSDIGLAIVNQLISPVTRSVTLACRDVAAGEALAVGMRTDVLSVDTVAFDAADTAAHEPIIDAVAENHGDLDVVIVAFGVLGEQSQFDDNPADAATAVMVNFGGAVSSSLAVAKHFRSQGHGTLIVLSSVAGERVRQANFVYGATKAGLDAFAQGLGDSLVSAGAHVLVVRPGFVHSAMTEGMKAAPFSTTPIVVAQQTVKALRAGKHTVWVPGVLRFVFAAFRHLPRAVWRRLPLG